MKRSYISPPGRPTVTPAPRQPKTREQVIAVLREFYSKRWRAPLEHVHAYWIGGDRMYFVVGSKSVWQEVNLSPASARKIIKEMG